MIEKLARAMLADELALTPNRDFDAVWADEGPAWLANARACLEALREPGDALIEAGAQVLMADDSPPVALAEHVWQAMIDVALERKAA